MIFSKLLDDLEIHRDEISFVNLFTNCVASLFDDPSFWAKIHIKHQIRSLLDYLSAIRIPPSTSRKLIN